ncbi:hypothetical protein AVEN_217298-1 [Araneus ventricosus]|uniref:Tc1-like transposase DDE domain-containing protein n=1 Tax=Araneus ventricosus TaxID=182803 RepID=A0A4Y2V5B1_ARAVE|nr:hypothetical protein AVEN_217298-1 [Araneus ventricosus]
MGHHGPEYLWQTKRLFKNDNSIQFLGQSHRASHARRIDQLQPQTTNSPDNETTPAGIKPLHSPKVTVRQDGATSHTSIPVKAFLIQKVLEDKIISRRCSFPWPPLSPNLAPADFWLWGYLKPRMYRFSLSSLSELKDTIRREVSYVHPDLLPDL